MITLVLMASGYGRRFGSNKLFYEIDGKAMYLHILEKMHCLSGETIGGHSIRPLVVTQYREIIEKAGEFCMEAVYNGQAAEGIAASVRLGAKAAGAELLCTATSAIDFAPSCGETGKTAALPSEWIVYLTADQPYLESGTLRAFINAAQKSGKTLASVCHGSQPGSPTMFHKNWYPALLNLQGDRGGRVILKKNPQEVFWYEIPEAEIRDIDYRE